MRTVNTISIMVTISMVLLILSTVLIDYSWQTNDDIIFNCGVLSVLSSVLILLTREKPKNKIDEIAENTLDIIAPFLECVNKLHESKYNFKKMSYTRLSELHHEIVKEIKDRAKAMKYNT